MELNWKEDNNLVRKFAKILLGDTLPNGEPVSSFILLDDTSRAELQRWANMSDAEFAAAQCSGDSIRMDVDDVIKQLEEKYALNLQLLDDLFSGIDADDLDIWEEISQWEDSDHDEPTEYFFSNPEFTFTYIITSLGYFCNIIISIFVKNFVQKPVFKPFRP